VKVPPRNKGILMRGEQNKKIKKNPRYRGSTMGM
jgi:hypothetical protein